jgi:hypothetical protein
MNESEPLSPNDSNSREVEHLDLSAINPEHLPVIHREIASTVLFSSDGSLLLGRKDPEGGGVYADKWHLPGGGTEAGEPLPQAAKLCWWRRSQNRLGCVNAYLGRARSLAIFSYPAACLQAFWWDMLERR